MASAPTSAKRKKTKTEKDKEDRSRKWTAEETRLFAQILADEENCFGENLEKLALKKSSNNELFSCVKTIFDERLKLTPKFHLLSPLDTSVEKLRKRYANIKTQWRKIDDRIRSGSGLAPENEPEWYRLVNDFLTESNLPLELNEASLDISMSDSDANEDSATSQVAEDATIQGDEDETEDLLFTASPGSIKKVVVEPHRKRKQVRSNKQALSNLAASVERVAEAQLKALKASAERDERFLIFRSEENEKQREHELRLARIYADANATRQSSTSSFINQVVPEYDNNNSNNNDKPCQSQSSLMTIDWNLFNSLMNNN